MKLKITVDGKVYEVEVEASDPEQAQSALHAPATPGSSTPPSAATPAAPSASASPVDESKICRSPIAGVVVRVPAQVGQSIQVNDVLLVLEAMKMETVITSAVAGKVAKIHVKVGDAVQGGQVLVDFV